MQKTIAKTVLGIFTERTDVEDAIGVLREDGFPVEDISIIMRDQREADDIEKSSGVTVAEGAASGAMTGALLGALAGLVGAAILPGLGAIFIGGPLAAGLGLTGAAATTASGAVTGAVAGGIIGALMGIGLPREEAVYYEDQIRHGAILLAVPVSTTRQEGYVANIFEEYNASDIRTVSPNKEELTDEVIDEDYEDYSYPEKVDQPHFAQLGTKGGKTRKRRRVL